MKGHASLLEDFPDVGGHVGVQRRKNLGIFTDNRQARSKVGEGPGHLEPDHAGTDQGQTLGEARKEEDLVRGDRELRPGERGDHRLRASGDDDLPPLNLLTVDL